MFSRNKQQGFTLIEMLIVVSIIGILSMISIPQYQNYLDVTAKNACKYELSAYKTVSQADSLGVTGETSFEFQSCKDAVKGDLDDHFTNTGNEPKKEVVITDIRDNPSVVVSVNGRIQNAE